MTNYKNFLKRLLILFLIIIYEFEGDLFVSAYNINSDSGTSEDLNHTQYALNNDLGSVSQVGAFSKNELSYLQSTLFNNSMYKLNYGGLRNSEKELYLSFQSQNNIYYTQIIKGEVDVNQNHKEIVSSGNWGLVPDSTTTAKHEEKKYIIALSEVFVNNEKYSIIVQTYEIETDTYGTPYLKTEIQNFIQSLQPEFAIKKFF
jgi:hypothetical protein